MGTKSSPRTCPWTPALFLAVFLMIQAAVSSQRAEKELGDTCSQYECVAYGQICSADYKCICLLGWYQYPNTKQCTVSDPVQSLTATDVTSSDISVSWLPPPTSGTGEVIGYVLRVYNSDDLCLKRRYFLCAGCTQKPELRTNCPSSSETASSLTQEDLNNPAKIISGAMYNIPPYRNLTLTVSAIKNNAEGIEARLPFVTKIGTPRQYTSLEVDPIRDLDANQVHINVSWTPGVYTGPYFTHLDILKKELPSGVFRQEKVIILNEDNRTYLKTNLQAGWDYRVTVMAVIPRQNAENLTGPQFRPWVDVRMPSLPPGQVQLVSVRGDNYNADEMTLSFRCPPEMERNGTLRGFVVRVMVLSVQDNTTPQLQGEFFIPLGKHHREPCSYKVDAADLNGIEVLKNYSFEVKVRGEEFDGAYTDPVFFFASEKIPILDRAIPGREVLVPVRSFGGAMDIKLCALCAVNERQGPVQEVGLLICVRDSDDGGCSYPDATGIKNLSDINATTWARSRAVGFAIPFWASPDNWLEKLLKDPSTDYLYTIGADKDCDTNTVSTFCNGPLPLNKVFTISLFTCNGAGCDEYNTYYTDRFNTKDQDDVGDDDGLTDGHITAIAVGVIVLSVAVVVVIIFIVRKMRGRSFPT